ncbi:MAG: hypothetical protein ACM3N4_06065 [Nitrososphaerota archaeon]
MPAKSFIGEIEDAARRFYATMICGEVSDANVRGYLRAASQIEEIWQETDARVKAAIDTGTPPWEAYAAHRYPLAFIRAARTYQVFVRELLAADAAADPATIGYLPRVTYDQANALCHHIQPNIRRAVAALHEPAYAPDVATPLKLGPRIEADGACPLTHLEGIIAAAREVREWAAGLLAEYQNAVAQATRTGTSEVPAAIAAHVQSMQSALAQADAQLRFGTDLVGEVTRAGATEELHEQAEDSLWEALSGYFLLNQVVASPDLLALDAAAPDGKRGRRTRSKQKSYQDQRIRPSDLWRIAAPSARSELRGTRFGTEEMKEMCEKMGGVLSAGAQQYLDEVEKSVSQGDAYIIAAMANCPFEPLYRARRHLHLAGAQIPAGHEFHWNFHRGHIEQASRFSRINDWQECAE